MTSYRGGVLRDDLQAIATAGGCVGFGVTSAEPFDGVAETMARRRAGGLAAELAFTYRDPEVAADVRRHGTVSCSPVFPRSHAPPRARHGP